MSLINKMLQDLELRHASVEGAALPHQVRILPMTRSPAASKAARTAAIIALMLTTSAATWWLVSRQRSVDINPAVVAPPLPVTVAAAPLTPGTAPPAAPVLAPAFTEKPLEAEEPQPPLQPGTIDAMLGSLEMRNARIISAESAPTAKKSAPASAPEKTRSAPPAPVRAPAAVAALPVEAKPIAESASEPPPKIERNDRMVTAPNYAEQINLLLSQRRLEEAQTLLNEVITQQPAQSHWVVRLARVQIERGDLRGAAETLRKHLPAGAANADYRALNAVVLQRLTQHAAAASEYQAALRLSPNNGVWWMGLGISLEADNRNAEAREAFARARSSGTLTPELERFVDGKTR